MHYPHLFSPFSIRGMSMKNRLAMAPMETHLSHADGSISREQIAYYRERALGGVGLVMVEFTCVDSFDGHSGSVPQPRLDSPFYRSGHARLADAIRAGGARACVQLSHAGRQTLPRSIGGRQPVCPSATPSPYFKNQPRALEDHEIRRITQSYATAAGLAMEAGYEAVVLHGAHGYLLSQFLSPLVNKRDDDWGGDLNRRARFPIEVIKAVRAAIGERPLLYRMGVSDFAEGGLTLEDSEIVAPRLCEAGVDAIDISIASLERTELIVEPMSIEEGWRLPLARRIRNATGKPVITAGQIRWPEMADKAIADGDTDMISLGRPLLADPQWPNKARAGRRDDIRPCTSCNWCVMQIQRQMQVGCAENPRCGNELDPPLRGFGSGRKAVVIGGGPGGMAAALLLDQAGFAVELVERRPKLGGGLITSATPPSKDKLFWYQTYLLRRLEMSGVAIRTGESASVESIVARKPDVVIVATGAKPAPLEGFVANGMRVEGAANVLLGEVVLGDPDPERPIVIYGGGETGVETAEFLSQFGHKSVVVTRSSADLLARNAERLYRISMLRRVHANPSIRIAAQTRLVGADATGVTLAGPDGETHQPASMLVLAHGFVPDSEVADALAAAGLHAFRIGDANRVARIGEAVRQAYQAVMALRGAPGDAAELAC